MFRDRRVKIYCVYIMASRSGTLYIGVSSDLEGRVYEHKHKSVKGFTNRYRIARLVYYEEFDRPGDAIEREKELKGWTRAKKIALVETENPTWRDLSRDWVERPSAQQITPVGPARDPSLRSG